MRRSDGIEGSISFEYFDEILEQIGAFCLECEDGIIEDVEFEDFTNLRLACGMCGAIHLFVAGQLLLEFGGRPLENAQN